MSPSFISPGVYVIEKDISDYAPTLNSSVVGIVGFASKGPVNKATLITSPQQLIRTFGEPNDSLPGQGLLGAIEVLESTNAVYFVRGTITPSAVNASATIPVGACPGVFLSGNGYGVSSNLYLKVQVGDNNGVAQFISPKEFSVTANTVASTVAAGQGLALAQIIGGVLDGDKVGVAWANSTEQASGILFGSYAGSAAYLGVSAYSDSNFTVGLNIIRPLDILGNASATATSAVQIYGTTFTSTGTSSLTYKVESLYPGAGYNAGTKSDGTTSGNSVEVQALGEKGFIIQINENGAALENFKASLTGSSFVEDIINTGTTNTKSELIRGYLASGGYDYTPTKINNFADKLGLNTANIAGVMGGVGTVALATPRFIKLIQGTQNLAGGTNGTSTDNDTNSLALIGSPTVSPKTGIYALDDDSLNISIAITPGLHNQNLQNALINLAESSQNFLAVVAPPYGAINTVQEAIDWTNGRSDTRSAAINNSYAAVYWPWVKTFDVFGGIDRWYDPSIYAARQMAYTDSVGEPWFAPAGFIRGRLTKPVEVEVVLNQGDRDSLYSGGNIVNPIVNFPQRGIAIWGQRTAQRASTALDRVNVRRMMIVLRKILLAASQRFVFEPNDVILWEQIEGVLDPLLDDIKRRRGITEYKVICDETTNTPARIDRNELWCKVLLKPTKTAEVIVFEINLTNQSAKLGS